MLTLTFTADVAGVERRIQIFAAEATDLKRPLARIGGRLKAKSRRRFQAGGPGWAPLAPSTLAKKVGKEEVELLVKSKGGRSVAGTVLALTRKKAAAEASLTSAQERGQAARALSAVLRQRLVSENLESIRRAFSSDKRRFDTVEALVGYVEKERRRQRIHGLALRAAHGIKDVKDRRRLTRIGQRRFMATESATGMLGALSESIAMRFDDKGVTVYSKAYIGAIHNYGGTAGHGAQIPARPFLALDAEDVAFAVEVFKEHLLGAWEG